MTPRSKLDVSLIITSNSRPGQAIADSIGMIFSSIWNVGDEFDRSKLKWKGWSLPKAATNGVSFQLPPSDDLEIDLRMSELMTALTPYIHKIRQASDIDTVEVHCNRLWSSGPYQEVPLSSKLIAQLAELGASFVYNDLRLDA
jgi:hypothetical protein